MNIAALPFGLHLPVRYIRARDGDTIEVTALTGATWAIRVMNVDTPEIRSSDERERAAASRAKAFTEQTCEDAAVISVLVPLGEKTREAIEEGGGINLLKLADFDRVDAHVYCDGASLAEALIKYGHGSKQEWK